MKTESTTLQPYFFAKEGITIHAGSQEEALEKLQERQRVQDEALKNVKSKVKASTIEE